jgi:stearoyl-CoA desaturase (Delta-9 desaturase)
MRLKRMPIAGINCYPTIASAMTRHEGGGQRWMALVYLALHLLALSVVWTGVTWVELLVCLLLLQARGFCVSAAYHRLLAHRSFKTSRLMQFLLCAGACTSLRGGPLWWVALHRHHHRYPDTEADIFAPQKGFWWGYGLWLVSGQFEHTDYRRIRDLARFPELCWLNRWWLLPSLALAGLTL